MALSASSLGPLPMPRLFAVLRRALIPTLGDVGATSNAEIRVLESEEAGKVRFMSNPPEYRKGREGITKGYDWAVTYQIKDPGECADKLVVIRGYNMGDNSEVELGPIEFTGGFAGSSGYDETITVPPTDKGDSKDYDRVAMTIERKTRAQRPILELQDHIADLVAAALRHWRHKRGTLDTWDSIGYHVREGTDRARARVMREQRQRKTTTTNSTTNRQRRPCHG